MTSDTTEKINGKLIATLAHAHDYDGHFTIPVHKIGTLPMTNSVVVLVLALAVGTLAQHPTSDDFVKFLEWFDRRGGAAPKLTLANFGEMGSGLKAVQPIQESDVVITVPLDSVVYVLFIMPLA